MAISPQRLTIYLYSAHRAVIFAIAQLSCCLYFSFSKLENHKTLGRTCECKSSEVVAVFFFSMDVLVREEIPTPAKIIIKIHGLNLILKFNIVTR